MNKEEISSMFADLPEEAIELCVRQLRGELTTVVTEINKDLTTRKLTGAALCPTPEMVFRAFAKTPPSAIRVVLVGQDPYFTPGDAMGLSFSSPKKKIPPSLRGIYKCLVCTGLMVDIPKSADISFWADQGVLLLNTALTTVQGEAKAHVKIWKPYIDALVTRLDVPGRHWMLFGNEAQRLPVTKGIVHKWGHPSPLNTANRGTSEARFELCLAFRDVSQALGIVWDPVAYRAGGVGGLATEEYILPGTPPAYRVDDATFWLFTDGGATSNGMVDCKASWGFCVVDSRGKHNVCGAVTPINIPGKKYKSSNQRGELTAILEGLKYLDTVAPAGQYQIMIVSDSQYSLNCITTWYPNREKKDDLDDMMNKDLLTPIMELYRSLADDYTIVTQHTRSHRQHPPPGEKEYFIWYYNDVVDKLCDRVLKG